MQFKVPQFIDVEDKLFGPFTFKQGAYIVGGAGMIFVAYKLLPFFISIFIILPVAALTLLLTFYKINNKPFAFYLQAAINYALGSKLYVWKQRLVKKGSHAEENAPMPEKVSILPMQAPTNSIKDITWNLNVQERAQEQTFNK